jgi:beta-glucanase (GH16 family)
VNASIKASSSSSAAASSSKSPSPSHTPASSGLPPALTGTGWHLAFNAGFTGSSLDTSQWDTCYPFDDSDGGCTNFGNKEYQWYLPSQVGVSDGNLNLVATREPTEGADSSGNPEQYSCRSGMVDTASSLNFEYGYVQIQARIAMGTGLWPALWLAASNLQWPPEVDIMEHWNSESTYGVYLHTSAPTISTRVSVPDLDAWHTFALSWEPNKLTWYLDNRAVFSTTQDVPQQAMYFIANVAETTPTTASAGCDGSMQVSSVKIWQHS